MRQGQLECNAMGHPSMYVHNIPHNAILDLNPQKYCAKSFFYARLTLRDSKIICCGILYRSRIGTLQDKCIHRNYLSDLAQNRHIHKIKCWQIFLFFRILIIKKLSLNSF